MPSTQVRMCQNHSKPSFCRQVVWATNVRIQSSLSEKESLLIWNQETIAENVAGLTHMTVGFSPISLQADVGLEPETPYLWNRLTSKFHPTTAFVPFAILACEMNWWYCSGWWHGWITALLLKLMDAGAEHCSRATRLFKHFIQTRLNKLGLSNQGQVAPVARRCKCSFTTRPWVGPIKLLYPDIWVEIPTVLNCCKP